MKIFTPLILLTATLSGCLVYEGQPTRTVVVGPSTVVGETVITTLPRGYHTRVYRGSTYYYHRELVYRSRPAGGYVVVGRPW